MKIEIDRACLVDISVIVFFIMAIITFIKLIWVL